MSAVIREADEELEAPEPGFRLRGWRRLHVRHCVNRV